MKGKNIAEDLTYWEILGLKEWVAVDLETTGLNPRQDAIIELGAVRFENGQETGRFSQLVNPGIFPLDSEIVKLTGIRDQDLETAPSISEVAGGFLNFVGEKALVGHHIAFDLSFLASAPETAAHFHPSRITALTHDTSLAARFLAPCLDAFSLAHLGVHYNIEAKPCHRAADDAASTGALYAVLLTLMVSVPLPQLSDSYRLLETTNSPLLNTLRAVLKAVDFGYTPPQPPPDALTGSIQGRVNFYTAPTVTGYKTSTSSTEIAGYFKDSERFRSVLKDYEVRTEQVEMAEKVFEALHDEKHLVVEAGTGVGKSMGYLLPSLLSGHRIAVSTYTKNLQDQLFYDEIPRLGALLQNGFKAALLKGRRNYLCRTKWRSLVLDPGKATAMKTREMAGLIPRWVAETKTGDISEINAVREGEIGNLFDLITSEPGYCTANTCRTNGTECPLTRIRRIAQKSDVTIINHSLAILDILAESPLLGDDLSRIIFDEAHHIEDVATDQLGSALTAPGLKNTLDRIGRLCRQRGDLYRALSSHRTLTRLADPLKKITTDVKSQSTLTDLLFSQIAAHLRPRTSYDAVYSTSFRYKSGDSIHAVFAETGKILHDELKNVLKSLTRMAGRIEQESDPSFPVQIKQELRAVFDELVAQTTALKLSISADDVERVYWVEVPAEYNRALVLNTAPLEIAETLAAGIWEKMSSVILTSATLATGTGKTAFNHLKHRLGLDRLDDKVMDALFGSPFNYRKNCMILYTEWSPSPSDNPDDHFQAVAEICRSLTMNLRKGMLVLFTSYSLMQRVAKYLDSSFRGTDVELFVQRGNRGRDRLIRRFRRAKAGSVLLGTDSFWEGIDLPGPALQIVVIPKLPFAVPSDPIIAARIEKLRNDGGNPFFDYQVPQAVLRMRQGTGRLIRSSTDAGVIVIMDSRVVTKQYGSDIRRVIPGVAVYTKNQRDLENNATEFFQRVEA